MTAAILAPRAALRVPSGAPYYPVAATPSGCACHIPYVKPTPTPKGEN